MEWQTSVWMRIPSRNSMTSFLDGIAKREDSIRKSMATNEQDERLNNSVSFYESSMKPTLSKDLRNQQHIASRWTKLAAMISQFWTDNWISVTGNDSDIINNYIMNMPSWVRDQVAQRFHTYTHSTEYQDNSNDFALEMWWRDKDWYDYLWDWVKWLGSYLWYWFDRFWRFTKQLNDATTASSEAERDATDIMNLAEERYWTLALSIPWYMDEEKWNDLQREIDNYPEQVEKQERLSNILLWWAEWTVMTAVKAFPVTALVDLWIWVLSQIPVSWDVLQWANEHAWDIWHYIAALPWLWQYRESLYTDEAKREFDEFLWNMAIWLLVWKIAAWKNKWKSWWNWWEWWWGSGFDWPWTKSYLRNVISKIDPREIWESFKNRKLSTQEKDNIVKEKMWERANKALVNPEVWQNDQAASAFAQLDDAAVQRIKKSKQKSKTVLEEFDKISKVYENAENAIANTIEKMYWIDSVYENPISTEAWGKKYTSNKPRKYVSEWIETMKEIAEYQEEQQYIDLAEQIARDWNLTPYNILEMARSLSKQFDLRSVWKEWPELSKMKSRVDSIRQWLKNMLKRELDKTPEWRELWVNPLEYYDSLWSPVIWTRSNIVKLRSAWNKAKSRITNKSILNKLWTWIDKIPFTKARAARMALDSIQWERIMSMLTKEKELGKIIDSINKLNKELPKDATKEQIDAIMKDWAENHPWMMEDISILEWEVIEPAEWKWFKWRNSYLEEMFDTVEIEKPKWLWENQWVWPDLQEPIISDENWYVWRRWKTTESYKWQKKWEWWTPEEWNETKTTSPEEIVEEKIQEKTEPRSRQEKANKYLERFWMTLEQWKKQLEAAWIKPEDADKLIEKLSKKNFKTSSEQPTIFDDLWNSNPK